MARKQAKAARPTGRVDAGCCSMESMVTVDERGQMVLPKELRERMGIKSGTKLAVVAVGGCEGGPCCITLLKADALSGSIQVMLKPMLGPAMAGGREAEEKR